MLLFSNLQSISFSILFLLISITKQSNKPKGITNKLIQLINKGFPKASNIKPSGTNIKSAKSINVQEYIFKIFNHKLKLNIGICSTTKVYAVASMACKTLPIMYGFIDNFSLETTLKI